MKTTHHQVTLPRPSFPLLARAHSTEGTHNEFAVLFTSEHVGTVVWRAPSSPWHIGDFHRHFCSVFDSDNWRILGPGEKIELENEF